MNQPNPNKQLFYDLLFMFVLVSVMCIIVNAILFVLPIAMTVVLCIVIVGIAVYLMYEEFKENW